MDWADQMAMELMLYLGKCTTIDERRKLIAAYLRREKSSGKLEQMEMMEKEYGTRSTRYGRSSTHKLDV
jgi:hypothetical protein